MPINKHCIYLIVGFFLPLIFSAISIAKPGLWSVEKKFITTRQRDYALDISLDIREKNQQTLRIVIPQTLGLRALCDTQTNVIEVQLTAHAIDLYPLLSPLGPAISGTVKNATIRIVLGETLSVDTSIDAHAVRFCANALPIGFDLSIQGSLQAPARILTAFKQGNFSTLLTHERTSYHLRYAIANAAVGNVVNITTSGTAKKDLLTIDECSFDYKKTHARIQGRLADFNTPHITCTVETLGLLMTVDSTIAGSTIAIRNLTIAAGKSKLSARGTFNGIEKTFFLRGNSALELSDMPSVLSALAIRQKHLEHINPKGISTFDFWVQGNSIASWSANIHGASDCLTVSGIALKNLDFIVAKSSEQITLKKFYVQAGNGDVDAEALYTIPSKIAQFDLHINALDMTRIAQELGIKNKKNLGILTLSAHMNAIDVQQHNAMEGNGTLAINDSNLWVINFLKGLGEFLFIPDYEGIVFKNCQAKLTFANDTIRFSDITSSAPEMTITGEGTITNRGIIDFSLFPDFNSQFLGAYDGFKKHLTGIVGGSGLAIRIQGTLAKPRYAAQLFSITPLKNKVKNIFKSLLENPTLENVF